jgi:hypothetical protein
MADSDDETREKIRQLQDYSSDSDRPSEITLANVGSVKIRIPKRQHRTIGWSMVVLIVCGAAYLGTLAVKTVMALHR